MKLGKVVIEGKTKIVYELPDEPGCVLLQNKDRITAGDGARAHDMEGKAVFSNNTNGNIYSLLNAAGKKQLCSYCCTDYCTVPHNYPGLWMLV